jgi:hypothetical protein
LASVEHGGKGAYGFVLTGVEGAEELLVAGPGWHPLALVRRVGISDAEVDSLGEDRARLRLVGGGEVFLERDRARATYTTPKPLSTEDLVHPYLAPAAAIAARWHGRESFHAGAFIVGGAWVILGEKGAGKSSTLASLAQRGIGVLADDVVVVDDERVFAGPRTVDLRDDAAHALMLGTRLPGGSGRERWRVALDPVAPEVELRGWILATWSAGPAELVAVPPSDRLRLLARSRVIGVATERPDLLLRLAGLPAWEYRRPAGWDGFESGIDQLLGALDA